MILVEGGSWSSRAVDGALLESKLREHPVDAAVVQITLPGANHFEREYILRNAADSLTADEIEALSGANVIMLREISRTYDSHPIIQLDRNLFTDRVYTYSTPARSYAMARAASTTGDLTAQLAIQIGQHALFNWLRVGEVSRLESLHDTDTSVGYQPLDTTQEDTFTDAIPGIVAGLARDGDQSYPDLPWADVLETLGIDSFGFPVDFTVSFELPTLRPDTSRYARWMASQTSRTTIIIDDGDLYWNLDDVGLWYDSSHLRREGAEIYTSWLAERIRNLIQPYA